MSHCSRVAPVSMQPQSSSTAGNVLSWPTCALNSHCISKFIETLGSAPRTLALGLWARLQARRARKLLL